MSSTTQIWFLFLAVFAHILQVSSSDMFQHVVQNFKLSRKVAMVLASDVTRIFGECNRCMAKR